MKAKLITLFTAATFSFFTHAANAQITPTKSFKVMDVTLSPPGDVYTSVETPPNFPGGLKELMKFLIKHIDSRKTTEQGRIILAFIVEKNGSLSNIQAIGQNNKPKAVKEVIRVMESSPKWEPGKQDGKHVRVQSSLPINLNYQNL
jgi:protein TonB